MFNNTTLILKLKSLFLNSKMLIASLFYHSVNSRLREGYTKVCLLFLGFKM